MIFSGGGGNLQGGRAWQKGAIWSKQLVCEGGDGQQKRHRHRKEAPEPTPVGAEQWSTQHTRSTSIPGESCAQNKQTKENTKTHEKVSKILSGKKIKIKVQSNYTCGANSRRDIFIRRKPVQEDFCYFT